MTVRAYRGTKQSPIQGAATPDLFAGESHGADDLLPARSGAMREDSEQAASRARSGLQRILLAIEERPRSMRTKRLVKIVTNIYQSDELRIDVQDLKALGPTLAAACIDCLTYCVLRAKTRELGS